jgi:hypothetical protein
LVDPAKIRINALLQGAGYSSAIAGTKHQAEVLANKKGVPMMETPY